MDIQVGKKYVTKHGDIVLITGSDGNYFWSSPKTLPFSTIPMVWDSYGVHRYDYHQFDLEYEDK